MEVGQVSKMLAYSFVSEIIEKKKLKKRNLTDVDLDSSIAEPREEVDLAELNFGELEEYYKSVLDVIENTPEVRENLVNSLKKYQEDGKDLNDLYPTEKIVKEPSLKKFLFLDDVN